MGFEGRGGAGEGEEAASQGVSATGVAPDHQDGVVAGNRAQDVGHLGLVERRGEVLGRARRCAQDDEVGTGLRADEELPAQLGQPVGTGCGLAGLQPTVAALAGDGVDESTARGTHLEGVELDPVARQGGLGDPQALAGEQVGELGLRVHLVVGDQVDDELVPRVRQLMQPFGGVVPAVRESISDPAQVNYRPLEWLLLPDPWYKGRVVLIGDAAHATTPHMASGAGLAAEDGLTLAEEIARHDDVATALRAFMDRRFERARLVVENSVRIGEIEMAGGDSAQATRMLGSTMAQLQAPY